MCKAKVVPKLQPPPTFAKVNARFLAFLPFAGTVFQLFRTREVRSLRLIDCRLFSLRLSFLLMLHFGILLWVYDSHVDVLLLGKRLERIRMQVRVHNVCGCLVLTVLWIQPAFFWTSYATQSDDLPTAKVFKTDVILSLCMFWEVAY